MGYYIAPSPSGSDLSSLGEVLLRTAGGGAVGDWSPTGEGVNTGHDTLEAAFLNAVFKDGITQVGLADMQAKLAFYASGSGHLELIDTYLLFGDPATAPATAIDAVDDSGATLNGATGGTSITNVLGNDTLTGERRTPAT